MKVVVTGGTGAVGGAYCRALVPAGYDVKVVSSRAEGKVKVFESLGPDWERTPQSVEDALLGNTRIDPLTDLGDYVKSLPFEQFDLSDRNSWTHNPFEKADAVVLTSGNGDPDQGIESAQRNHAIDANSIDAAVEAGVKVVIYTSSNWRTMALVGKKLINAETDEAPPRFVHYALAKAQSVRHLKDAASHNRDILFVYNDHCWYPRETFGCPPSNIAGAALQYWVAECETQMHVLKQLQLGDNPDFKDRNWHGFTVVSDNRTNRPGQPKFSYDISNSARLGVVHEFNVYDALTNRDYSWRRIPVVMK
ncbi:MAG: NAD-dependent epimerase/dehydratase family protein [archaeon]